MLRSPRTLAQLVIASLLLAACTGGGADDDPRIAPEEAGFDGERIALIGTDDLLFIPDELAVPDGPVELELHCEPAVNHNVVIMETGEEIAVCSPGGIGTGTLDIDPGTYTYVCTVPGHSATMRGELSVG